IEQSVVTDQRSVLEISDSLAASQRLTIGRAKKLVEQSTSAIIEVVAVGKGISLLVLDTPYQQEIQSLMNRGVVFTVCQCSLLRLVEKIGHPVSLLPGVNMTRDGYSYAENLKNSGYIDEFA
ncbi:hypothetical protein, partial [Kaarinaea lacus]